MKKEIWRDVQGYEGIYQVSDQGRVRSLDRISIDSIGRVRFRIGRVLSPVPSNGGVLMITLCRDNEKRARECLHTLVGNTFKER